MSSLLDNKVIKKLQNLETYFVKLKCVDPIKIEENYERKWQMFHVKMDEWKWQEKLTIFFQKLLWELRSDRGKPSSFNNLAVFLLQYALGKEPSLEIIPRNVT